MSVQRHALLRSIQALSYGLRRDTDKKAAADEHHALAERDHQFQLPISGVASARVNDCVWRQIQLDFETIFPGPTQAMRDPDFEHPTIAFGFEITSANPVSVHACVTRWTKNDQGDVTGCTLAVTAHAIGSKYGDDISFKGVLHVSFQGWGAPDAMFDDSEGGKPTPLTGGEG